MYTGYEIYDGRKEYTTKDGRIYTAEMFREDHSAVVSQKMAVYVYGDTIMEVYPLSYLRGINRIKNDVPDEEAIEIINSAKQLSESESAPIERIAASLEYLVLLSMGDKQ